MKLKLDENLPEALLDELSKLGHDVDNVRAESLTGRSDLEVWHAAQSDGRVLITQDLDFSDIRQFAPGTHHGLILVRLRVPGRLRLTRRIREAFASEPVETWKRSSDGSESPCTSAPSINRHRVRTGPGTPQAQLQPPPLQPQCIPDHNQIAQPHRDGREHGAEETERRQRHARGVIEKCPEQILLDRPQRRLR
jgi:predicted nuclease of predicted toxin-antitoxin system